MIILIECLHWLDGGAEPWDAESFAQPESARRGHNGDARLGGSLKQRLAVKEQCAAGLDREATGA